MKVNRREFIVGSGSLVLAPSLMGQQNPTAQAQEPKPMEAPFERTYPAPEFKPQWKKQQLNRTLIQDFVIFAHSDLEMVKKLLGMHPNLLSSTLDWGDGDFESALGAGAHMGRHDIVEFLLEKGARIDIFAAAMLGQLEAIQSFLKLQPKLIDAKGPHGFSLHHHAQVGKARSSHVLDYLQTIKKVEL